MELSFSNSCLNSSLLSAPEPALYADAIARAGSNGARRRTSRGAQEEAAGVNLAAAAKRGIRRSGRTIAPPARLLYTGGLGRSKQQGREGGRPGGYRVDLDGIVDRPRGWRGWVALGGGTGRRWMILSIKNSGGERTGRRGQWGCRMWLVRRGRRSRQERRAGSGREAETKTRGGRSSVAWRFYDRGRRRRRGRVVRRKLPRFLRIGIRILSRCPTLSFTVFIQLDRTSTIQICTG